MPLLRTDLRQFGGAGLFAEPISTSNLYRPDTNRVLEYSRPMTDARQRSRPGQIAELLEQRLAEYHQAQHCVSFSSGFWALVITLAHRALPDRTEVLIPSLTYRRLADAVNWGDRTPVFVDIEHDSLAVSVDSMRERITDQTSLLLAVHPIVNCCDAQAFIELSKESGVPLVFDAVESVHETVSGRRVGSFGTPEVFSLHASKLINGMEGGYVTTDDPQLARDLRDARSHGQRLDGSGPVGMNAAICEGHAAFTLAALDELDASVAHNRAIYEAYRSQLASVDGIRLLEFDPHEQTSFKNIVVEVEANYPHSRDRLVQFLNGERILARAHYDPPLHRKQYPFTTVGEGLDRSDRARGLFLNLPCGARVSTGDVVTVCELLSFLASISLEDHNGGGAR